VRRRRGDVERQLRTSGGDGASSVVALRSEGSQYERTAAIRRFFL